MKTTKKPTKSDMIRFVADKKNTLKTREMVLVKAINKYKISTGFVIKILLNRRLVNNVLKVYVRICDKGLLK